MEIHSVVCPPSSTPQPQLSATTHPPEKRKRVRRWHHRGFTGCSTCRRRHVRCDEASPSCKNCTRLGLECDGTQGRMTFKVYGPPPPPSESSSAPKKRDRRSISGTLDVSSADGKSIKREQDADEESLDGVIVSPTTVSESRPVEYRFQEPMGLAGFDASSLQCIDGRYYTHFIDQVATLLLIYDNSSNINPFRRNFPDMAHASHSVASAMQAVGALHLANTSQGQQRNTHFQHAMGKYGEVVKSFRQKYIQPEQNVQLSDFATCLLLSLFEVRAPLRDTPFFFCSRPPLM